MSVSHNVNVVMCIDGTSSMFSTINDLKKQASSFYPDFVDALKNNDEAEVAEFRIKVIVFRDYSCDDEPMVESPFYLLPDQNDEFLKCINSIEAKGGKETVSNKDEPTNSLEALALAIKSDWTTDRSPSGKRPRHIIMLFTDAAAISLGNKNNCDSYPSNMPVNLDHLFNLMWNKDETVSVKFLAVSSGIICVVPETEPWLDMQMWARYFPLFPDIVEKNINKGEYENAVQFAWDVAAGIGY